MPRGLRAADRLPVLRLSVGMLAHQTPLPGFVLTQTQTFTHSIFHPQGRGQAMLGLEPHRCLLREEPSARVLWDALRAADRGNRTHTARQPSSGYGGVPPAPAL